jgi:hypothetical protein
MRVCMWQLCRLLKHMSVGGSGFESPSTDVVMVFKGGKIRGLQFCKFVGLITHGQNKKAVQNKGKAWSAIAQGLVGNAMCTTTGLYRDCV